MNLVILVDLNAKQSLSFDSESVQLRTSRVPGVKHCGTEAGCT